MTCRLQLRLRLGLDMFVGVVILQFGKQKMIIEENRMVMKEKKQIMTLEDSNHSLHNLNQPVKQYLGYLLITLLIPSWGSVLDPSDLLIWVAI